MKTIIRELKLFLMDQLSLRQKGSEGLFFLFEFLVFTALQNGITPLLFSLYICIP